MKTPRLTWLCFGLVMFAAECVHQGARPLVSPVQTTPKLEILDQQIKLNARDAQANSNRDYTLALLG